MIFLVLGFVLLFIVLCAFCVPKKRIGLFLPIIWFIVGITIDYGDNLFLEYLIFFLGVAALIIFLICIVESTIRIVKPDFDFTERRKERKFKKEQYAIGRWPGQLDMYNIFPVLRDNADYQIIYNRCGFYELEEFTQDWTDYFLDLQSKVYLNPECKPEDLYETFNEWYQRNERWKYTSYHHLYYMKQEKNYSEFQ